MRTTMKKIKKKAAIFDLDNTIYPVSAIGEQLFKGLFNLIKTDGRYQGDFSVVKEAIKKRPFQSVAKEFRFDERLTAKAMEFLSDISLEEPIKPFNDYSEYRLQSHEGLLRFLVTTGFTKLQWSKIKQMGLESDFDACFVVDPARSDRTKKDVFVEILAKYKLKPQEVLVIGDDVHSEIKAGKELGMETLLYDHAGGNQVKAEYDGDIITHYKELENFL